MSKECIHFFGPLCIYLFIYLFIRSYISEGFCIVLFSWSFV